MRVVDCPLITSIILEASFHIIPFSLGHFEFKKYTEFLEREANIFSSSASDACVPELTR